MTLKTVGDMFVTVAAPHHGDDNNNIISTLH